MVRQFIHTLTTKLSPHRKYAHRQWGVSHALNDATMDSKEFREWFRTIRFFERERGWFFLSPDGLAVGPYASERNAEQQAARLAKILKRLDDSRSTRVAVIEFALAGAV